MAWNGVLVQAVVKIVPLDSIVLLGYCALCASLANSPTTLGIHAKAASAVGTLTTARHVNDAPDYSNQIPEEQAAMRVHRTHEEVV